MRDPLAETINRLAAADLTDHTGMIAVKMLAIANRDCGMLRLQWDEFIALTGCENRNAGRRHLTRLAACNILHYETNAFVRVDFLAWSELDPNDSDQHLRASAQVEQGEDHAISAPARRYQRADLHNSPDFEPPTIRTHAGALSVCLSDPSNTNKELDSGSKANRQTAVIDPRSDQAASASSATSSATADYTPSEPEKALSFALLSHIGIKPAASAIKLASAHPFGRIRDCVAYWWMGRESMGGKFKETPAILITWLERFDEFYVPPMAPAFFETALYRNLCITPAERKASADAAQEIEQEAEQIDQAMATVAAQNALRASQSAQVDEYRQISIETVPDAARGLWEALQDELRLSMPGQNYDRYVRGCFVLSVHENEYQIGTASAIAAQWLQAHLEPQLRRRIGSAVKRSVTVSFCAVGVDHATA